MGEVIAFFIFLSIIILLFILVSKMPMPDDDQYVVTPEIEKVVNEAWLEIKERADKINDNRERIAKENNEAPCSVCGKTEYIVKYRNVTGYVDGKISGSFNLFGGSISGYIDGKTITNPVLSCRDCENEKLVMMPEYQSANDLLEDQMPSIFEYSSPTKASSWLRSKGLEVARGLEKYLFIPEEYKRPSNFTDEQLIEAGLEKKFIK